jgi:predicted RNA-binding Zn ribbon-like protein
MRTVREAEVHRLIGGAACLDFANTLNGHRRAAAHEYLHDPRDLVLWSRHAQVITPGDARLLLKQVANQPSTAAGVFRGALALREAIFRVFDALANHRRPAESDLERLNRAWRTGQRHSRLVPATHGFQLQWDDDPGLERITRILATSAISLLTSAEIERIRACAGDRCDWLFVDGSRNHLRQWCSMDECGNRAKMKRRQQRRRSSPGV